MNILNIGVDNKYFGQSRPEMLEFIPKDTKNILEFGCSNGLFGQSVKDMLKVSYWGVEINKNAAIEATKVLDKVINTDINDSWELLPLHSFDCIVFNDVLEHLIDPYSVLNKCKDYLSDSGVVVTSIPNVRFIDNLINLIIYKHWQYTSSGILDITHLRFFTKRSIIEMFNTLGYDVKIKGINMSVMTFKIRIFHLLTLNYFEDTRFLQFACVASPRKNSKLQY
ncbi:MAG TPA: class I SAM-dependent methyltransferase [Candidatus Kapabacteria bacterium]|nr:class I SAM-dependent methyltransferase [Candidatus Kapabacteria bacterium]